MAIECCGESANAPAVTNNEIYLAAREYIKRGFSVIPLKRDKKPSVPWKEFQHRMANEEELREWFSKGDHNIGIVTGAISGISVIDFDDLKVFGQYLNDKLIPMSPLVITGKGVHIYCRYSDGSRNFAKRIPGIDLRSEGGYVVAPPSVHESGKRYDFFRPLDVPLATLPEWVMCKSEEQPKPFQESSEGLFSLKSEGQRNDSIAKAAGSLIGKGYPFQDVLQICCSLNASYSPPLAKQEVKKTIQSIWERHHLKCN